MYQIFAKSLHVRNTFFWELIERHGARTFGTSNIPRSTRRRSGSSPPSGSRRNRLLTSFPGTRRPA